MALEEKKFAIGIDLGGTKIQAGIVDELGKIHEHIRMETDVEGGSQSVQKQLFEAVHQLRKNPQYLIEGIGIGVAGQIDQKTGEVIFAPNLNWHHVPLKNNLEAVTELPVKITNDVRAITLGEWKFGAGKGYQDLVCLFLGTGIGSGIVSGGKLLIGCSNTCGELGHMTIDFNGPLCTCGNTGCLEAFAGGWGIAARAQEKILSDPKNKECQKILELAENDIENVTSKIIFQAAVHGNLVAQSTMHQAEKAVIAGCVSIVNAFNPCLLILGGGLMDGIPEWMSLIIAGIQSKALAAATRQLKVVKSILGPSVGVIGSATLIFND